MNKRPEILAIIPARGNSKSIPKKNIKEFAGFPMLAFSIAAAKQSRHVTRVIVSTDNQEIAQVAREYGAEVPFMRPDELALDNTLDYPVIEHALLWLAEQESYHPNFVIQLRPTSPIRPQNMVDDAVELILAHPEADSVRGVVPSAQNPYKMWFVDEQGRMKSVLQVDGIREPYNAPRQDLPDTFWQTGHIDVIRAEMILKKESLSGDVILPLMVDPRYSVDIDTLLDWERAEANIMECMPEIVWPGQRKRPFPKKVSLLVMDFDGVMTDDRVWVDAEGNEMVAANRGDGLGLERLRSLTDIQAMVISKETNRVVAARCKKLDIPLLQGVDEKPEELAKMLKQRSIPVEEVIYIGNDLNDLPCFPLVGFSAVPANALPEMKRAADLVLRKNGGYGAVRELCDILISRFAK
jgi:N-acylneuraminate cytidylyltransferase